MPEMLELNLDVFRNRWPAIGRCLEAADCIASAAVDDSGMEKTLVIDGLHLSSGYDRRKEAQLQASLIPNGSKEAWVYGFGLGDIPRVLLARPMLKRLNLVIMNSSVARISCQNFDHRDWLNDPRVNIVAPGTVQGIQFPFAAVPPCLQLADESMARLRDLVVLELSTPYINSRHGKNVEALAERLEENEKYAVTDGDVAELFNVKKGQRVAVAGAGPTLSRHYEYLRKNRHNLCLVAVDAAFKPLVEAGIHPDLVVVIDGHEEKILPFFKNVNLKPFKNTPLVYFPIVHSSVLDCWPGPRLTSYPSHSLYEALAGRYPKGRLFSSGSVIHPTIDLAVKMGASEVLLLGADFSFPGEVSHVEGCVVQEAKLVGIDDPWVLNGHGVRVATTLALRGFFRDLEDYIAEHPKVVFINGSKRGAQIEGTVYLEEAD